MKAPVLVFSANANRPVPGVKVPVAAPSWALARTVEASCWSVFPRAGGNWSVRGCSAAGSSEMAGGGPLVEAALVVGESVCVVEAVEAVELLELDEEDDPQPASAAATARARI